MSGVLRTVDDAGPRQARCFTDRLELVAGNAEIVQAEIDGGNDSLARLLNARVPDTWPPPLNNEDTFRYLLERLSEAPDVGWWCWYVMLRADRSLVGNVGLKGRPSEDGTVDVGYSILEERQGAGYATEATRGLLSWAFQHEAVHRVVAETLPYLTASIRVLLKCGFRHVGDGSQEGVILFELLRDRFEPT